MVNIKILQFSPIKIHSNSFHYRLEWWRFPCPLLALKELHPMARPTSRNKMCPIYHWNLHDLDYIKAIQLPIWDAQIYTWMMENEHHNNCYLYSWCSHQWNYCEPLFFLNTTLAHLDEVLPNVGCYQIGSIKVTNYLSFKGLGS